ncbi:MAG: IclR family transcriptional regulator [Pleomorphochaeta sp.]
MEDTKVTAVERTMLILETIANNNKIILSDIAKKTKIHKSTVFRFLNTLEDLGYIAKDPKDEQYFITTKMNNFHSNSSLEGILLSEGVNLVETIAKHTQETVHLAKLDNNKLTYLHKIESTQTLRVSTASHVSGEAPLYCTGLGKAMLAYLEEDEVNKIIKNIVYEKFTETTITDNETLLKELKQIREQGYSIDNEEHELGIMCVSAPILVRNKPIAAISISGPLIRMKDNIQKYSILIESLIDTFQDRIQALPI